MKIIIPTENKDTDTLVCASFGRAPFFMIYDTETEDFQFIDNSAANSQSGAGIKAAQIIIDSKAEALIAYQCGQNAADVLKAGGIKIYKAQMGLAKDNLAKYKEGKLSVLTEIHPGFHHHGGNNQ
ncbi:MAG: NifB/NifX family molybdenum-iron cluster-binding protein [Endomicrobiaceae bacterium]